MCRLVQSLGIMINVYVVLSDALFGRSLNWFRYNECDIYTYTYVKRRLNLYWPTNLQAAYRPTHKETQVFLVADVRYRLYLYAHTKLRNYMTTPYI